MENPPHFGGSVLSIFWGVLSIITRGDEEMKELRKVPTDGVLQFDLTVKYFPGIIVRGKHDKGLLQTLTAVI